MRFEQFNWKLLCDSSSLELRDYLEIASNYIIELTTDAKTVTQSLAIGAY